MTLPLPPSVLQTNLAGGLADQLVVGADVQRHVGIDLAVERDHRNAGIHGLLDDRGQRVGRHRADDDGLDALRDQALDVGDLLGSVVLAVGDDQIDIGQVGFGIFLVALDHVDPPGAFHRSLREADLDLVVGQRSCGAGSSAEQRRRDDRLAGGSECSLHHYLPCMPPHRGIAGAAA